MLAAAADEGVPVPGLYLQVIHPAMVEIGRLWETSAISVAQEQLATQITQLALAELSGRFDLPPVRVPQRRALVSSSPGEQHAIGVRMVADFLESAGWEARVLTGYDEPDRVATLAAQDAPDLVAISTSLSSNLLAVGRACSQLRSLPRPPLIVVGGRAYDGDSARASAVGADEFAPDPGALLGVLSRRFADG